MLLATACGGGGSDSGGTPNPPATGGGGSGGSNPTWTSGVYAPASQFKNRCETVRTGADLEGKPFPDMAGSTTYENFWLRSWTHETYLWNDEVVDRNPANYDDRLDYFALLRTTALTPSGAEKDQFHFSQPTEEYLRERNSAPTAGYGAVFFANAAAPPRDFRVAFTEPGTPASETIMGVPNLVRGARILEVDGVDLVNANTNAEIATLNDGLFPQAPGEMHSFVVQDPGSATSRTINMISEDIVTSAVNRTAIVNTGTGDAGYILISTFNTFASEEQIRDAIDDMATAGVSDLVIDLRYNGGGLLAVASQLAYMIAGPTRTAGKTFEELRFNDDANGVNPITAATDNATPFYDTALGFSVPEGAPLPTLNLDRIFILSTDWTCSASEAVINALRGVDVEVILIGERTCGKPYGFYPQDNCGETYFTIQFQGVNDKGFGDYADGFVPANAGAAFGVTIPGCSVADDFDSELGDETEDMLAAALQYRADGSCPAPPPSALALSDATASEIGRTDGAALALSRRLNVMRYNRDMRMPD